MTKNTPDKTRVLCTYKGQNCLKTYLKTRIGQMYCLRCTADSGVNLEANGLPHIKGKYSGISKIKLAAEGVDN